MSRERAEKLNLTKIGAHKIAPNDGAFRSNIALACAVGILTGRARILGVFSDYLPGAVYPRTYIGAA